MAIRLNPETGVLEGDDVTHSARAIKDLRGYFADELSRAALDPGTVVYRVQSYMPVPEGEEGAICAATTFLEPGCVGDEYFLTRGHFHAGPDRPELCVCIAGEGALIMMSEDRRTWMEPLTKGAVCHVPVRTAHRAANTGRETLVFVSYWPSETGHDYESISSRGFSASLIRRNGEPELVPVETRMRP